MKKLRNYKSGERWTYPSTHSIWHYPYSLVTITKNLASELKPPTGSKITSPNSQTHGKSLNKIYLDGLDTLKTLSNIWLPEPRYRNMLHERFIYFIFSFSCLNSSEVWKVMDSIWFNQKISLLDEYGPTDLTFLINCWTGLISYSWSSR